MSQKKILRENCWEQFLNFGRNLSKVKKVHAFRKKSANNELNIFFLNNIEENFLRYKNQTKFNQKLKAKEKYPGNPGRDNFYM